MSLSINVWLKRKVLGVRGCVPNTNLPLKSHFTGSQQVALFLNTENVHIYSGYNETVVMCFLPPCCTCILVVIIQRTTKCKTPQLIRHTHITEGKDRQSSVKSVSPLWLITVTQADSASSFLHLISSKPVWHRQEILHHQLNWLFDRHTVGFSHY